MATDPEDVASLPTVAAAASADTVSVTGAAGRPVIEDEHSTGAFDAAAQRFEEHGELGRGGMGRVADAFDRTLARQVAIKSMLAREPAAVARFEREARITAQLEHPGIVALYETGRHADGTPYYVMRRIDGKPLDQAVRGATFAQRLALVPNLLAVCDAAAFAHARSIIHRDIKPSNILLGRFGETTLIDWGLARRFEERDADAGGAAGDDGLTHAGSVAGTPGFMAPEQARGEHADARADVYALGATLFYALAGEAPHRGSSGTELITSVASGQAPSWQRLPEEVPDDLRAILGKALAADRDQRYRDAGALAADLRRFVTGNLVAVHRYSALERLRRFVRRHRVAVAVGAVATVVLAAVVVVAVLRIARERDDANAARERATVRADDLTFAKARLLIDENPTLAVAVVRPLVDSPRWREAGDVLAAASARGVAWRLPASSYTWRLDVSPGGEHAYTVGEDGKIWYYDLRTRAARVAVELGRKVDGQHRAMVSWWDETHLVVFDASALAIVDVASGARRTIPIAAPAANVGDGPGVLAWVDTAHHAWRLDGETPRAVDVGEEVGRVVVAPDGLQLAVLGKTALWLVDRDGAAHKLLDEPALAVSWDATAQDMVVAVRKTGHVQHVHLAEPPVWSDVIGLGWPDDVALRDGHFVMQDTNGVLSDRTQIAYKGARPAGLAIARDGLLVAAATDGAVDVFDHGAHQRLHAPRDHIGVIASRPASHYLLATDGPDLLVWDLDAVFPKRRAGVLFGILPWLAGPHQLLVSSDGKPSTWIDLHGLTDHPGPPLLARTFVAVSPSQELAMTAVGEVHVMRISAATSERIATGVRVARFVDDHRILVIGNDGHAAVHDLDRHTIDPLAASGAINGRGSHGVVTLRYRDGSFERIDLASGRRDKLAPAQPPAFDLLGGDGRWWFATGQALACWERDGRVVTYAVLPEAITNLFVIDDATVAADTGVAGYLVDTTLPGLSRRIVHLGAGQPTATTIQHPATQAGAYLAVPQPTGGALVVDTLTGAAWPVGQAGPTAAPEIALDGSALVDVRDRVISVWPLAIPPTREAAVALAAALSNAVTNDGDSVTWPDQR